VLNPHAEAREPPGLDDRLARAKGAYERNAWQ
jgi:hypothetical protein